MRKELLKTRAYQIYIDELKLNLDFAVQNFINSEVVSGQVCKKAREIFHTLKGSSGFFGFDEIYKKSSELEILFSRPLEELVCSMSEVRSLISQIEYSAKNLPPAVYSQDENNA